MAEFGIEMAVMILAILIYIPFLTAHCVQYFRKKELAKTVRETPSVHSLENNRCLLLVSKFLTPKKNSIKPLF